MDDGQPAGDLDTDTDAMCDRAFAASEAGDVHQARDLWARAAELGSGRGAWNLAVQAELAGDDDLYWYWAMRAAEDPRTFEALTERAADGNTAAMINLARLSQAIGNADDAQAWMELAAEAGDESAQFELRFHPTGLPVVHVVAHPPEAAANTGTTVSGSVQEALDSNDDGMRLVLNGEIEDGLRRLEVSARCGWPGALATYSWCLLERGDYARAVTLSDEVLPACEQFADELPPEYEFLVASTSYELVNARSNLALCRLAMGGSPTAAVDTWVAGAASGHLESVFYPAVVAERAGDQRRADRIASVLSLGALREMTTTMSDSARDSVGWFADWCLRALEILERHAPLVPGGPEAVPVNRVRNWPAVTEGEPIGPEVWQAIRAGEAGDMDEARVRLRGIREHGTPAERWLAITELGSFLVDDPDPAVSREGWDLLVEGLQAPYRDLVARNAWNIAQTLGLRTAGGTGFSSIAVELGDGAAMVGVAQVLVDSGRVDEGMVLAGRVLDQFEAGSSERARARALRARVWAERQPEDPRAWFLSTQGAISSVAWGELVRFGLAAAHHNVDTAMTAISTSYFDDCAINCFFSADLGACPECGRTPGAFLQVASGFGDGAYPVLTLLDTEQEPLGVMTVFQDYWDGMSRVVMGRGLAEILEACAPMILGTLDCDGHLIVADAARGLDERDVAVTETVPPGPYRVVCWVGATPDDGQVMLPAALAAVGGSLRDLVLSSVPVLEDDHRDELIAQMWGRDDMVVRSLFVDARTPVLMENFAAAGDANPEMAAQWLLQLGEVTDDQGGEPPESAWGILRTEAGVGSTDVLEMLEARGVFEPELPWWLESMATDPRDRWHRVLMARDGDSSLGEFHVEDEDRWTRRALAERSDISEALAETLAIDADVRVRINLASNTACPEAILSRLAVDHAAPVRARVAANRATPTNVLGLLAAAGSSPGSLAGNPRTSIDDLELLSNHPNSAVRVAVARNESTPAWVLAFLARDRSPAVRNAVKDNAAS